MIDKFTLGLAHVRYWEDPNTWTDPAITLDAGGITKFGIAQRYNPDVDAELLTPYDAERIFREKYWEPINLDSLPTAVAVFTFDASVNQGPVTAAKLLQEAAFVKVDGIVGPKTQEAALSIDLKRFKLLRAKWYAVNSRKRDLEGLFNRLEAAYEFAKLFWNI